MFFPHDVSAAGLENLRTGDNLRFRPRVEGQATIATDLKAVTGELSVDEIVPEKATAAKVSDSDMASEPLSTSEAHAGSAESSIKTVKQPVAKTKPKSRRKPARKTAKKAKADESNIATMPEESSAQNKNIKPALRLKKSEVEPGGDLLPRHWLVDLHAE